jgi:predicted membrane-bound spermidine synthase
MNKTKTNTSSYIWLLYLALVIEGGALMAVELVGAKLIAPYYGNSLYVWAAVLAVTLGGLAFGYYYGGNISQKYPNKKTLFYIMFTSSLLVFAMPLTSGFIMNATMNLGLKAGVLISTTLFLMPPLVCFGMVSPMVVRLITNDVAKVGGSAGKVYFISTIGGVLATFWFGFYAIPYIGLKMSCVIIGSLLLVPGIIYFAGKNKFEPVDMVR